MFALVQIQMPPELAGDVQACTLVLAKKLGISVKEVETVVLKRRSIDARQRGIKINLSFDVFLKGEVLGEGLHMPDYKDVTAADPVHIVGAGPAGLFAALECLERGLKPIVLERGKDVRERRKDLAALTKLGLVDGDSNYCFGEGGAGTYSDGKLYTRSSKRGDVLKVLEILVMHGADPDILIDAHPHIGTNKLPDIIKNIRNTIVSFGGEVHFNTKVVDFVMDGAKLKGLVLGDGTRLDTQHVILATGHSARDIFELLQRKNIAIEAKPFALGVRIEHPQALIDSIQYKCEARGEFLPPAPYSVVKQVGGRGVYSFCMCPGGIIAPCATSPGEVVTNGWSPSMRHHKTANSGIVVELNVADFKPFEAFGPLAGMYFQASVERLCWELAGKTQRVPAQRLMDFMAGKTSNAIPKTSYHPGTTSMDLAEVLPAFVHGALREGFALFGKSMPGYLTNEAVLHAPESRTSSPVRIPRDLVTLEHVGASGLYPCGEGGGYAGGIMSAALDGIKVVEAIAIRR